MAGALLENPLGSRFCQGSRRIAWLPMRRDRIAGSSSPSSVTVVHSHVARPSGPEKLHVISQMPRTAQRVLDCRNELTGPNDEVL